MNSKGSAEAVCGYKCGALPSCAPLAAAFVPAQENAQAQYEPDKALARGTLFPGLDLPFGNMVNDAAPNVPLAELMAIDFAAHDLSCISTRTPATRRRLLPIRICSGSPRKARSAMQSSMGRSPNAIFSTRKRIPG